MRKHPEVIALFAIALALFANMGIQAGLERVQREAFRIRPLVHQVETQVEKVDIDRVAEEAIGVAVREVLREVCR